MQACGRCTTRYGVYRVQEGRHDRGIATSGVWKTTWRSNVTLVFLNMTGTCPWGTFPNQTYFNGFHCSFVVSWYRYHDTELAYTWFHLSNLNRIRPKISLALDQNGLPYCLNIFYRYRTIRSFGQINSIGFHQIDSNSDLNILQFFSLNKPVPFDWSIWWHIFWARSANFAIIYRWKMTLREKFEIRLQKFFLSVLEHGWDIYSYGSTAFDTGNVFMQRLQYILVS